MDGFSPTIIIVCVLYLATLLGIGAYAARFNITIDDYFLANRKIGIMTTAISSTASSESGWVLLGAVGMAYSEGLSAIWFVPGILLGYVFNWYCVAPRLRSYSKIQGSLTIPDYLEARFDDKSSLIRWIAILIVFFSMLGYVAAQLNASGKAFKAVFPMSYELGVAVGAAITISYTLMGGFRAVSWTDVVQGMLMAFGLIILPIVTVIHAGGMMSVMHSLSEQSRASRLEIVHDDRVTRLPLEQSSFVGYTSSSDGSFANQGVFSIGAEQQDAALFKLVEGNDHRWRVEAILPHVAIWVNEVALSEKSVPLEQKDTITAQTNQGTFSFTFRRSNDLLRLDQRMGGAALIGMVVGLFGIGLGYPGQPHVLTRYMASRNKRSVQRGRFVAITWGIIVYYGAISLGLSARVLMPELADPEDAFLRTAIHLLPAVLTGIMLAAVLSAIRSTADSQLLVAASAVARDLYEKAFHRHPEEKILVRISRITVLSLGVLALLLALTEMRAVFWFVLVAWSCLGASFGPLLILSLFWKKVTKTAAAAGMITGFLTSLIWYALWHDVIYELVPAFFLSGLVIVAISLLQRPSAGTLEAWERLRSHQELEKRGRVAP